MVKPAMMAMAALLAAAAAMPAAADPRGPDAANGGNRPVPGMVLASKLRCGGEHLRCPAPYAKVCNPSNGKCCCAVTGTYR